MADHITSDLFDGDVEEREEERDGLRRGKLGIRDGLASGSRDNDEY